MMRALLFSLSILLLAAFFWWRGEQVISANGPTFDEGVHLAAGYGYWRTGDFHANAEHPPFLKMWWSLPLVLGDAPPFPHDAARDSNNDQWMIADAFLYRSGVSQELLIHPARRMNLAIGAGVVLLAGWWSRRLWDSRLAGIAAAGFAAFDPNLLALACVLTTDCGFAFFGLLSAYLLWEYAANPGRGLLLACGASLGLLLGTKFSAVAMVVALVAAALVYLWRGGRIVLPGRPPELRGSFDFAFRLGVIALIVLAATYGFVHFNEWGRGLKFQLTRGQFGGTRLFLNGDISEIGWYHYFVVALGVKLPIGLILASIAGLLVMPRDRRLVFLLLPPALLFAALSYSRVDLGIRVVLPVVVFLYPIGGRLFASTSRILPTIVGVVSLAWCASTITKFPIAYFNEAAGDRPWNWVADSNLDWGQGLPALRDWMQDEKLGVVHLSYFGTDRPEAYGIRFHALPGTGRIGPPGGEPLSDSASRHVVAISANNLLGIYLNDPDTFAFLRNRTPDRILAGSILIFDLTNDPEALAKLRAI
jgi:hypothetical protein